MKYARIALAIIFLALLALVLAWAVRKDFESKAFERLLGSYPAAFHNNYVLNLNSFDMDSETVRGTLSLKAGLPVWDSKEQTILFGPLSYVDLTYTYAVLRNFVDVNIALLKGKALPSSAYSKAYPAPIDVSIKALGRPELYPFDKYFIMGAVTCPAYAQGGKEKEYLHTKEDGESLSIRNSVKGFFVRYPTNTELDGIKRAFLDKKGPPATNEQAKELNNHRNRFALVMERPLYLQIMTIVLGIIALMSALYIGFKTPFKDIPVPVIGFIIGLWGIRNILMGDLRIFPSYFDYALLSLYLLLFAGIIFRMIKGGKT
jgi:hypothetical protein